MVQRIFSNRNVTRVSENAPGKAASDIQRNAANLLAALRFFAVASVVALTAVIETRAPTQSSLIVIATFASVVSVIIVTFRVRLVTHPGLTYALLGIDSVLAVLGILEGGGIDSPFLLYALLPPLTAALLLNRMAAAALATFPGITVVLAHTVLNHYDSQYGGILEGNYLTLVPVYAIVCFTVALLPFYANLNVRKDEQDRARRNEQRILRAELHDKLAQSLAALTMGLRQMGRLGPSEAVDSLVSVSERSYAELRELLDLLEAGSWQPTAVGTLARLVETWQDLSGIDVTASLPPDDMGLPPEVSLALLGIAREALNNVGKHSGADKTWVSMERKGDTVVLSVKDNGKGFGPNREPGHGRRIMQERADGIGAELDIVSEPDAGTEVRATYRVP